MASAAGTPLNRQTETERFLIAIADHFTIADELKSSGTAIAYRARERLSERTVVLRVFNTSFTQNGATSFRREIQFAMQLEHPRLVPVLDTGRTDGRLWYTSPYVIAKSVQERLESQASFDEPTVVQLLRDIARALVYAHKQGAVHGDLKPANVLVASDGVYIADFGVARAHRLALNAEVPADRRHDKTFVFVVPGALSGMAPEVANDLSNADARADLFSLGVMAYRLLTGQMPFVNDSAPSLLRVQFTSRPTPVSAYVPQANPLLEQLVMQLLEPDPQHRPPSAAQVLSTLSSIANGSTELKPLLRPQRDSRINSRRT